MRFNRQNKLGWLGRAKQRAAEQKFNLAKINAIKDLGKSSGVKTIESAGKAISSIVAADTAQALATRNNNSYKAPGLSAWTDNFNGNPNKDTGSDGESQTSSTTELGG